MVDPPLPGWIASSLSTEQKQPFGGTKERSSILAAAGSGKTRTLVHLLAHDLRLGVPASSVVAFTFTEKAAEELLARVHAMQHRYMPSVDLSGIFIGTIHSWCLQHLLSQPAFFNITPVDELHIDALAGRLYSFLKLEEVYKKPFPKAIQPFLTDLDIFYNEHLSFDSIPPNIAAPITAFLTVLSQNRLLPFGGMIRSAVEHLEATGPLLGLRSLYVDEYQDVNPAQTALLQAMLPPNGILRAVGDDLQSIYNWRGSDVRRILEFPQEFAPADVFRLSTNYRSRPEILGFANSVADDIALKDDEKVMRAGRQRSGEKTIHWISTVDEAHQAETIVRIVRRFHNTGVPYSKIAILMRSVVKAGQPIYEALKSAGIPVQCPVLGRGADFIDHFLLPVLRWLRTEQIAPRSSEEERQQEKYAHSVWKSVSPWLSGAGAEDVFWNALNRWHDLLRTDGSRAFNLRRCLYEFLDVCGVRIAPEDTELMVGVGLCSQIIRRVEEVHRRRLRDHRRRSAVGVVTEASYAIVRNYTRFGESLPLRQDEEKVLLTTVHQAKGLEWPIVCLPMLNARRFPVPNRGINSEFPLELTERYGTRVDDERRLFYVAVTRARERLFLLDTAGGGVGRRSVFLEDVERHGVLPDEGLAEATDGTWSVAEEDLGGDGRAPIAVGLSDLLLYIECPYQFGLRKIAGVQPAVGDELGFGKGLHELLQRRADHGRPWSDEEIRVEVERHVHLPLAAAKTESTARKAIIRRLAALQELDAFPAERSPELPVEIYLAGDIVTGTIDFVYTLPDGSMAVRDWKATVHEEFTSRYMRQVQVYAYALRQMGAKVSRGELIDVAASAQVGRLVGLEVDIAESTVTRLIGRCGEALRAIRNNFFPPTPGPVVCQSCDVRNICAVRNGDDQ